MTTEEKIISSLDLLGVTNVPVHQILALSEYNTTKEASEKADQAGTGNVILDSITPGMRTLTSWFRVMDGSRSMEEIEEEAHAENRYRINCTCKKSNHDYECPCYPRAQVVPSLPKVK